MLFVGELVVVVGEWVVVVVVGEACWGGVLGRRCAVAFINATNTPTNRGNTKSISALGGIVVCLLSLGGVAVGHWV